jgi:hypothetical protein
MKRALGIMVLVAWVCGSGCVEHHNEIWRHISVPKHPYVKGDKQGQLIVVHFKNRKDEEPPNGDWKLKRSKAASTNAIAWVANDDEKFMVILPMNADFSWNMQIGQPAQLPCNYPADQFVAFESTVVPGVIDKNTVAVMAVASDPQKLPRNFTYKICVHHVHVLKMMSNVPAANPVPIPPDEDIVDATLIWDDASGRPDDI